MALVHYVNQEDAERALQRLNGHITPDGHVLHVQYHEEAGGTGGGATTTAMAYTSAPQAGTQQGVAMVAGYAPAGPAAQLQLQGATHPAMVAAVLPWSVQLQ
jgi:hypothetical protein